MSRRHHTTDTPTPQPIFQWQATDNQTEINVDIPNFKLAESWVLEADVIVYECLNPSAQMEQPNPFSLRSSQSAGNKWIGGFTMCKNNVWAPSQNNSVYSTFNYYYSASSQNTRFDLRYLNQQFYSVPYHVKLEYVKESKQIIQTITNKSTGASTTDTRQYSQYLYELGGVLRINSNSTAFKSRMDIDVKIWQ